MTTKANKSITYMDVLGRQGMKMKRHGHGHHQKRSGNNKKGVKVVYISSPMKVNTCASKFRDLVQELTGKDSDAASRFSDFEKSPPQVAHHHQESIGDQYLMMRSESPTYSDAATEPIDDHDHDVFRSYGEGSFLGMLSSSNLLGDSFQLDHAFKSFIN